MKKENVYFPTILFILLLISIIFSQKYVYIAPNLSINAGILIYPFTFLTLAVMYKNFNIKYVKQNIFASFILLFIFYLLVSIINSIDSITSTELISDNLRNIFTPNHFTIFKKFVYYPDITLLLTFSVIYFITHYIFITIYEATISVTNHLIAFILAILIGFILDQLLFVPLSNIPRLIDGTLKYQELIKLMTANFIIVIFSSIIMLFIYSITCKKAND